MVGHNNGLRVFACVCVHGDWGEVEWGGVAGGGGHLDPEPGAGRAPEGRFLPCCTTELRVNPHTPTGVGKAD